MTLRAVTKVTVASGVSLRSLSDLAIMSATTDHKRSVDDSSGLISTGFTAAAAQASVARGLSVHYLATKWIIDLSCGPKKCVYDVAPRIKQKGVAAICPRARDGKEGAAYVDVADDPHAGTANMMLSYTWAYTIYDISSSLQAAIGKRDQEDVLVWICCLCVNVSLSTASRSRGNLTIFGCDC